MAETFTSTQRPNEHSFDLLGVHYRCWRPDDAGAVRIERSAEGEPATTTLVEFSLCGPDGLDRVRVGGTHYTRKGGEWRRGREGRLVSEREMDLGELGDYYADMDLIAAARLYQRKLAMERQDAERSSRPIMWPARDYQRTERLPMPSRARW